MSKIRLLKISIVKKETLSVEYSREEKDKSITIISEEHKAPVHQDLKNAMFGLHVHFAILSDYVPVKAIKDITKYDSELIEPFYVSSIHQGGAEDELYVILTGHKRTASGKAVIINTPRQKVTEDETTRYKYMDELMERIEQVEDEVREYLAGKHAPETQQSLDFPEDEPVTRAKVLPPADGSDPNHTTIFTDPSQVGAAIAKEVNGKIEKKTQGRPKKVAQSAKHPSGEAHE